jgi:SAM-dependent methyltransferase
MISESDVTMAYRLLLGREPENEEVVTGQAGYYESLADLRAGFMSSPEFLETAGKISLAPTETGTKPFNWPPIRADVAVPPDILEQMIRRIENEFVYLGAREPHWSVLTEDRFKAENISGNDEAFYKSGELPVTDLRVAAARAGVDLSRFNSCFELGCGLGRITMWLGRQFPEVVAGDISVVHLAYARDAAKQAELNNIAFVSLNTMKGYQSLPPFDVFFSLLVLQHNPPPLMAYILETILTKLSPGGIAYFQVPTYILNYRFVATEYLESTNPVGDVEVHCLPQTHLFDIIRKTGCQVLEMREDGAIGSLAISNRLFLQKIS